MLDILSVCWIYMKRQDLEATLVCLLLWLAIKQRANRNFETPCNPEQCFGPYMCRQDPVLYLLKIRTGEANALQCLFIRSAILLHEHGYIFTQVL